jgi:hypothetical protein
MSDKALHLSEMFGKTDNNSTHLTGGGAETEFLRENTWV